MKNLISLSIVILCLYGCSPSDPKRQEANQITDSLQLTDTGRYDLTGCRGAAEPVIKWEIYPNSFFQIHDDSSGTELVDIGDGDSLIIKNYGCAYYDLTFRFITKEGVGDSADLAHWMNRSIALMRRVEKGIDAPVDIHEGLDSLQVHVANDRVNGYKNLKLSEPLYFRHAEISQIVSVDTFLQLPNGKYAVDITFSVGPL